MVASRFIAKEGETLMKASRILTLIVGVIVTFGAVQAEAADRFFQVQVKLIAGGEEPIFPPPSPPGPNCYSFLEDGTWIDPLFPNPFGTWVPDDSDGAVERYSAVAVAGPFVLVQEGQITPTAGNGMVRLQAFSTLYLAPDDLVLAQFMSTGHEVDGCP